MIKEQFSLKDKVALVVGGRGFLGQRFSSALAECGATVYAADLPEMSLAAKADKTSVSLKACLQRDVDVTNQTSIKRLVDDIIKERSDIDILVYSVTAKPKDFYAPYTECSLEGWQKVLRAELDGLFLMTQAVGQYMEAVGRGSIVLTSSIYGVVGNDQRIYEGSNLANIYAGVGDETPKKIYSHAGYSAVKGAVISMTRYLAAYWGDRGIRVNCISPGGVENSGEDKNFVRKYSERAPLGRKAKPDEMSGAIVYLASDASSYVTGHNLIVDGGWTAW
jgi:NAD(P)-dependent dehydrogenase (short-subunit alcohol dehydrogenase family)